MHHSPHLSPIRAISGDPMKLVRSKHAAFRGDPIKRARGPGSRGSGAHQGTDREVAPGGEVGPNVLPRRCGVRCNGMSQTGTS
ncbi:hypothetical protein BN12_40061 [Nostocoides japonicum T1-X7]|uniref:Uncharacterized protein n=1 Tax=Nostocoides japonicum T1-X7 TaxID=1194083 RepID=A0A077LZR8_9MICO|nr:hypothetical protein BN12_40061 [Tetrasphaera japonica T1-X7]